MAEESTDDGEPEYEERPWSYQGPGTRIEGTPTDIIYAGELGRGVEQNDLDFGLIFDDPRPVRGTLFRNQAKPEDGEDLTRDVSENLPTDYRLVNVDDRDTKLVGDQLASEEQDNFTYEEADGFDEDEIIVWYGGLAAKFIARTLDFNGQPHARFTNGDFWIPGLFQVPEQWPNAGDANAADTRRDLATNGKAPRVARRPLLRRDVRDTRILVDLDRRGGDQDEDAYEAHVFDAAAFADEFGEVDTPLSDVRNEAGFVPDDVESELEWVHHYYDRDTSAYDIIEEEWVEPHPDIDDPEGFFCPYAGDAKGWQNIPDGWGRSSDRDGTDFGISVGDDQPDAAEQHEAFVEQVSDELEGTDLTPAQGFSGGIEGLIDSKSEMFVEEPDADEVREVVYERVSHLDTDDL